MDPLGSGHKRILASSSISSVSQHFEDLNNNFVNNSLADPNNRYVVNTIKNIKDDINKNSVSHSDICEYISASILAHYIDAHSYFGRAISSLLNGDKLISKHLLYYSELRSGMSVLASNGIGTFNNKHFVINGIGSCNSATVNRNTHEFTWLALEYCFQSKDTAKYLLDNLKVESNTLRNWVDSFNRSATSSTKLAAVDDFLNNIGFDLSFFEKDKDARNNVSYRPTSITSSQGLDFEKSIIEVQRLWKLCEPQPNGTEKLDALLIRRLLQVMFKATHPNQKTHNQASTQFYNSCIDMLDNMGFSDTAKSKWIDLIIHKEGLDEIISAIENKPAIDDPDYVYGMIYRAFFLMRLSSIFINFHINSSTSVTKQSTQYWWETIGKDFGLFEDSTQISFFSDLWNDIEISLSDLENWKNSTHEINTFSLTNCNNIFPRLSTFEQVGLWNIYSQ